MKVKAMKEEKSHHKMPVAFIAGIAIIIWILSACGSSSPAPAVQHHGSPVSAVKTLSPLDQLHAWKASPAYPAFQKVQNDLKGVKNLMDLTPVQTSQFIQDIKAAKAYPAPASVDPGGYYVDALDHLQKGMVALGNANPFGAITHFQMGLRSAQHFKAEVKQATS
jgi:hypothetical protein